MKIINTRKRKSSQGKAQNIKIWEDISLENFQFWSGAKTNAQELSLDELEALESQLEDLYPEGMSDTDLNDLMWFNFNTVCSWVGHPVEVFLWVKENSVSVEAGENYNETYNMEDYDSIDEMLEDFANNYSIELGKVNNKDEAEKAFEKFKESQEDTENTEMKSKNSNADIADLAKDISSLANKIIRKAQADADNSDIAKATKELTAIKAKMDSILAMYDIEVENADLDEIELEF